MAVIPCHRIELENPELEDSRNPESNPEVWRRGKKGPVTEN